MADDQANVNISQDRELQFQLVLVQNTKAWDTGWPKSGKANRTEMYPGLTVSIH